MYNIQRNNYHKKPKASNIQTPPEVSQFIFELLRDKITHGVILDPCCGEGNLLKPWTKNEGFRIHSYIATGIDISQSSKLPNSRLRILVADFFNLDKLPLESYAFNLYKKWKLRNPDNSAKFPPALILCNPPFNGYGNKLGSEVWLDKIIELFGKEVPIVLVAPVGFCLNLTLESERRMKFENGTYPPIVSRITLPKDIFEGVIFHSERLQSNLQKTFDKGLEILIFNIKGLQSHYFYKPNEPKTRNEN